MSPMAVFALVVQGALFLLWAFLAFRWLFALRADAVAESGKAFPGPAATLRAFSRGLTDARYAKERLRLGILTPLLLGLSALFRVLF